MQDEISRVSALLPVNGTAGMQDEIVETAPTWGEGSRVVLCKIVSSPVAGSTCCLPVSITLGALYTSSIGKGAKFLNEPRIFISRLLFLSP